MSVRKDSRKMFFNTGVINAYNPDQPRDPKGSSTGGQWKSKGTKIEVTRIKKTFKGTHLSSNLESLENGFQERSLGVSIARSPSEEMSSPTLSEPKGTRGRVHVEVTGKGLDYAIKEHREYIEALLTAVEPPYDINAIKHLRSQGVDWVDNWGGIGKAKELHVINPSIIRILEIEKFQ